MAKSKDPVRLRGRKMSTGRTSLYLDIYVEGQRTYEYLHLYLVPEKTREDKRKNAETMRLAEAVRGKRLVDVRNGVYGFRERDKSETLFYDYYRKMVDERVLTESTSNAGNWRSALKHIEKYDPKVKQRRWRDITQDWVEGFRDYLQTEAYAWSADWRKRQKDHMLSPNSRCSYFRKLKACCKQAVKDGYILRDPSVNVEGISEREGTRMYLTLDEVRKLAATDCRYQSVKRAFLFSCLTGIRRSDIVRLVWGQVFQQDGFSRIIFKQKKTQGQEYLDLAPEAAKLMGKRGKATDRVFDDIHSPTVTNLVIRQWCMAAGIQKDITFHCGRHTFATMMLDLGTDIYTVSKLLGHRELSTTQIYAKVMDKNKQEAVASIPPVLPDDISKDGDSDKK